mmetsp:Transcript_59686/g.177600  ORF Transcript_59686/g.177600 Transcript_59686/m.177600 type:complete len:151 (-) Transcript_59686:114-566(-)
MECYRCGHFSVPQWMNAEATCLKCHAVLRRRNWGDCGPGVAVKEAQRQFGPAPGGIQRELSPAPCEHLTRLARPYTGDDAGRTAQRGPVPVGATKHAAPRSSGRVRMTCYRCGFSCVPQWMNTEATCLKCHAVLRRREFGDYGNGTAVLR